MSNQIGTPGSSDPAIWRGWAACCVAEGVSIMPDWVASNIHKDCKDPDQTWATLLNEIAHETDSAQQCISQLCMSLAWGDL